MKFIHYALKIIAVSAVLTSCQNFLRGPDMQDSQNASTNFASLKVSRTTELQGRALDKSEIKYAYITVSGHDIPEAEEPHSDFIEVSDGKNKNEVIIEKIPVGKDRIVTIKAYDENKKALSSYTIRAVTDIKAGTSNSIFVSKNTTAFGEVLYGIKNIYNFEELESDGRMDTIRNVIDDTVHPGLYNSSKLIGELQGFSFPYNASKEDYILKTGAVTFNYLLSNNFNVSINDPLSTQLENQSAANGIKIENIIPGNWLITVTAKDGRILDKNEIQIESGKNKDLGHLEHNGLAFLVRCGLTTQNSSRECSTLYYSGLKYDSSVPESERLPAKSEKYPGSKSDTIITVQNPIDEQKGQPDSNHEKFYLFDFKKANSVKIILNNGSEGDGNKYTSDLSADQKGVYCVHSKALNPLTHSIEEPADIEGLDIKDENLKKCFIDDPENKRFVVLFSEKYYGSTPSSVKAEFNKGINDHNAEYKGNHYTMTRHKNAFWYCEVPYSEIQATNQCGQPSYNFKVNDSLIKPPTFVQDGYIYQKFNGDQPANKFLVLIYSSQNEKEICARLTQAKKCKKLSDFDLKTEEGKKQISNFRLVPGTQTLYRSYHPYCDDKNNISDTSKKRMEILDELCTKVAIKADINLSDAGLGTPAYKMPEYYKEIIKNNNILYMTDCSYNEGYENSDSQKYAEGIKKIVSFINEKEGPYQIHCRIGTDRTGVVCAVLAGLCGASWEEIKQDYCASIEMGIYEYRGPGAVKYSLQKLLGVTFLEDVPDLQKALTDYFVNKGYLTKKEISTLQNKLQAL